MNDFLEESGSRSLEGVLSQINTHYVVVDIGGSGMMRKLFTPVVDNIKEHLNNLLGKPQLSKVQTMLLVGGFAESVFLQNEIKKTFSGRCRILVPHHASIEVAQGAVIFGKKPTIITERVMSTTYGIRCRGKFKSGEHLEEKK